MNNTTPFTILAASWDDARAELDKAAQMGYQTVLQCARVGQILAALKRDTPIREFVQRAGQEIPRLSRSTIHNYLTLGNNLPMLEERRPDSQRSALAMIAETRRPAPPLPPPVLPAVAPAEAPEPYEEQPAAEVETQIASLKSEAQLSEPMKARFDKALAKAVDAVLKHMQLTFEEVVRGKVAERLGPEREWLKNAEAEAREERVMYFNLNQGIAPLISAEEFKLIRGCLHADRVPDDLKPRFDRAFVAMNKVAPYFDHLRVVEERKQEQSERSKAMWAARKMAGAK